jgi:hypothetical protein
MDGLVDQKDAAKFLRVTEKFLEARRHRGGGPPFVRVGRLVRYRKQSLLEWIAAREVRSTSEEPR